MIGQTISHYKILEKLGEGGMGVVYLAEDTELDRKVALKFLPLHYTTNSEIKARFKREAKAAAALNHPNIITIHEIGEHEGMTYIAMEYVEGESLKELTDKEELNLPKILELGIQICEGLHEAHQADIVHRDLKPENILLDKKGRVKILDFGLAKVKGAIKLTKESSTLGTLRYMSPEQFETAEVDYRTDIWSVGVVLYEMITCQLPFQRDYESAVMYSILNEEPEPLARYKAGVSEGLQRLVNKALTKDVSTRYQSAADLLADLKGLQRESIPGSVVAPVKSKITNRRLLPIGIVILVVIACYVTLTRFFAPVEKEPLSQRKMLVVLPFENLGSIEDEYFADGLTEEIMSRLAAIHDLGVIARTSAIQYKNTDKTIRQIGQELGVEYALEGTVRWQRFSDGPSRVRVTPQLIKVSDATHLWSNRYDAVLNEIFQVQSEIAEHVTRALNIALLEPERRSLESAPTDNLEAYDYYLRGNEYLNRDYWTEKDLSIALEMYEAAIELDANFALAYAKMSIAHSQLYHFYHDRTEERMAKALEAANRSIKLSPTLSEAHLASGYYHYRRLEYERALEEFRLAQKSQPNNSEVFSAIGVVERRHGRFERAVLNFKKALNLDPRAHINAWLVAWTYTEMRKYADAERYMNRAISLAPDWTFAYTEKAGLYLRWQGDIERARQIIREGSAKVDHTRIGDRDKIQLFTIIDGDFQKTLDRISLRSFESDSAAYYSSKAYLYGLMNQPKLKNAYYDSARIILETRVHARSEDAQFHSKLGIAFAGLGRQREAIEQAELAVELLPVSKDAFRGAQMVEDLAHVYTMVGQYDWAIKRLNYLLSIPGWTSIPFLRIDPRWDPLRDNPRFQKLIEGGKQP